MPTDDRPGAEEIGDPDAPRPAEPPDHTAADLVAAILAARVAGDDAAADALVGAVRDEDDGDAR